eukprot:TRINITY_DN3691_c0_g1_i2.p1 TRINITY_DN3691_c0_g1~~TRINITY_DN3691_c0_g1_i2.p1  ORF type:complete len:217 (-),score=51.59 TRINITY_DN3691_c0_g1_i2:419-1069(-)
MAKVGEEDPRWLVQNRTDGKNVGNWHWAEKNLMPYTKKQLAELFDNLSIPTEDESKLSFTLEHVKGEISLNNRKRRIFYLYDIEVKLNWSGITKDGNKGKGTLTGSEIVQDNDHRDIKVEVKMDDKDSKNEILLEHVRTKGVEVFIQTIGNFLTKMKEDNGQSSIQSPEPDEKPKPSAPVKIETVKEVNTSSGTISTKEIRQRVIFSGVPPPVSFI